MSYLLNNTSPYALQHVSGIDCCSVDVHNCIGVHNYKMIIRIANKVGKKKKEPLQSGSQPFIFYPYPVGYPHKKPGITRVEMLLEYAFFK